MQADSDSLVRSSLVDLRKVSLPGLDLHHTILHTTIRNQLSDTASDQHLIWANFLCAYKAARMVLTTSSLQTTDTQLSGRMVLLLQSG
jgi:hypothetical protein